MSDYGEHGAQPVEDAVAEDPPTDEEVKAAQRRDHPQQAATARHGDPSQPLDAEQEPGAVASDDESNRSESPGEEIPAEVRESQPYDDAPGQGKFAPEAPNPPPAD